jgi:hypothetical protein
MTHTELPGVQVASLRLEDNITGLPADITIATLCLALLGTVKR